MKLHELQLVKPQQLTPQKTNKGPAEISNEMIPKNAQRIGADSRYGRVFTTRDNPGTVTKIVKRTDDLEKDAYFQYVSAMAKNDRISRNPYFPKIYNVKVRKDNYGISTYSVEMERLQNFSTLSPEEVLMLGERMFFSFRSMAKDAAAYRRELAPTEYRDKITTLEFGTVAFALIKAIEKVIYEGDKVATYIKDPNLRGALTILKHLIKNNSSEFSPDIHGDNIMVRRTPGGPQIVIVDPVCDSG